MERFKSFIREDENKEKPNVKKPGILKKIGKAAKKAAKTVAAANASVKAAQHSNRVGGQSTVQRHRSSVASAMSSDHADAQRADKITRRQWSQEVRREEVELDEGILKSYHAAAKQPWSKTVKDSKGTAGEYKQIGKGKDFTVHTAYRGSNKSQPHYVVRDNKIIGSGMTFNSALKDAKLKDKDVTHRSKFADGSILNKGMKEEAEQIDESPFGDPYGDVARAKDARARTRDASNSHILAMHHHDKKATYHIKHADAASNDNSMDHHETQAYLHASASEAHKDAHAALKKHGVDHDKYKSAAKEANSASEYQKTYRESVEVNEGILGATAGGAAGFAVGGPIGALTGAGLGHEFEKGARKGYKKVRRKKIDEISKEKLADYATKAIQDRDAARLSRDKYKSSAAANRFRGNDDAAKADDKRASDAENRVARRDRGGRNYTRKMLTKED